MFSLIATLLLIIAGILYSVYISITYDIIKGINGLGKDLSDLNKYIDPKYDTAPFAGDMNLSTRQGKNVTTIFNASHVDGAPLIFSVTKDPVHGTLTLGNSGNFTYHPLGSFEGVDTFKYKANDGLKDSNEATVTVNVTHKTPPTANNMTLDVKQARNVTNCFNASDVDGDPLIYVLVSPPAHGHLEITPEGIFVYNSGNYTGNVTFQYKANYMGIINSNNATVTLNVILKQPPTIEDVLFHIMQGESLDELLKAKDEYDDPLTFNITLQPEHGKIVYFKNNRFIYVPEDDYAGLDEFKYKAKSYNPIIRYLESKESTVIIRILPTSNKPFFRPITSLKPDKWILYTT